MGDLWQVRLKGQDGALVAIIDAYEGFSYTQRVNGRGAFGLRINGDHPAAGLFALDGQVEFWRKYVDGQGAVLIDWYREFEGLHRDGHWFVDEHDRFLFESLGVGYNDLLARAIIKEAAASAGANKSGPAESVMKAYVSEQLVTRLAFSGFSVEADGAHGNTVNEARCYDNLLATLQEIAAVGGGDFAVVGTGAATFQFRWYTGQLGTDRRGTVVFALERGNLAVPDLEYSRRDEITSVIVGGQGEEAARTIVVRSDAARIAESPWNTIERFAPLTNTADSDDYTTHGDAQLEEGRPKAKLSFQILQTPGCLYGLHYFLGDIVTVRFAGYETAKKIVAATVSREQGPESVEVEMEDIP